MDTKVCRKCREVKLLSEFGKHRASKDGHQTKCKNCEKERQAEYRAANPEKVKEYASEYRAANPEKIKEYSATYYVANSEEMKDYGAEYRAANPEKRKEWVAANPEKVKEYASEYRAANPEKIKEYAAEYQKANPEKCRANNSNRRAAKLEAIPKWLTEEDYQAMEDIGKEAKRIELETGIKMHVDHIHPLQGKLICGLQCPSNLQILTAAENCSKGNKFKPYVESEKRIDVTA